MAGGGGGLRLACGYDTAANEGALETGTIAVVAGGIDVSYPPENEERQRAIAERGLLIAEQPPGRSRAPATPSYRNRIIAGLSHGTVVVEAHRVRAPPSPRAARPKRGAK